MHSCGFNTREWLKQKWIKCNFNYEITATTWHLVAQVSRSTENVGNWLCIDRLWSALKIQQMFYWVYAIHRPSCTLNCKSVASVSWYWSKQNIIIKERKYQVAWTLSQMQEYFLFTAVVKVGRFHNKAIKHIPVSVLSLVRHLFSYTAWMV